MNAHMSTTTAIIFREEKSKLLLHRPSFTTMAISIRWIVQGLTIRTNEWLQVGQSFAPLSAHSTRPSLYGRPMSDSAANTSEMMSLDSMKPSGSLRRTRVHASAGSCSHAATETVAKLAAASAAFSSGHGVDGGS
jgi:hypothetical protein